MITKYEDKDQKKFTETIKNKKLTYKRKSFNSPKSHAIYSFTDFDTFCDFCTSISSKKYFESKKLSKNIALYLYKNTYYLVLTEININYNYCNLFFSTISEFAKHLSYSESFINKLLEHGELIIKKDAINTGIKYFSK